MWGNNYQGQLGIGNDEIEYIASPTQVTIPGGIALPSDLKFDFDVSTQSEESSSDSVPVLTAAPDSTQQASESEPVDQPEALEEEAVSVFKADATETNNRHRHTDCIFQKPDAERYLQFLCGKIPDCR